MGVPVLALAGSADRVVSPKESMRLARLVPDCRVAVVAGAGHMLPMERADEVADLIEGFMDELGAEEREGDIA